MEAQTKPRPKISQAKKKLKVLTLAMLSQRALEIRRMPILVHTRKGTYTLRVAYGGVLGRELDSLRVEVVGLLVHAACALAYS